MACTADCTVPYPVTTITTDSGRRSLIRRNASRPPAPGRRRSSNTTSKTCVYRSRYACSAESATYTLYPSDCATSRQASRIDRSSSTIRRLRKLAGSSCGMAVIGLKAADVMAFILLPLNSFLFFGDKFSRVSLRLKIAGRLVELQNGWWNQRQKHGHACATRRRAVHMDQTAVAGHDVIDRGQSQPRALAGLGGEKRFEYVSAGGRIHPTAVVAHHKQRAGQQSRAAGSRVWCPGRWLGEHLHFAVAGFNGNLAAA